MTHLKRKTISNRLIPLRAALALAVDDEMIVSSPADKVQLSKQSKGLITREQRESNEEIDPFTDSEINKILDAALSISIQAHNFFKLAFFSGLRYSELAGLKWIDDYGNSNINMENRTLLVNEALVSIGGKAYKQTPKTNSGIRCIDLLPMAFAAIKSQREITWRKEDYVFTRLDGKPGPITHNDHYYKIWGIILKKAGVRYRPPKQTRHTYASQLLSGGENIMYVSSQMGHADAVITLKRYAKWVSNNSSKTHQPIATYGQ